LALRRLKKAQKNLIKACECIEKNGGKPPKIKCVIRRLLNAIYKRADGVDVIPIPALKD